MSVAALPRRLGLDFVLMGAALMVLYAPLAPGLVEDWMSSGDYSHGFVVPIVSGWLLWIRRKQLAAAPRRPYFPGLFLVALAVAQYLVGVAASEFYLQRTSAVLLLGGWILVVFGPHVARHCVFAVAFLLFSVPPPSLVLNWVAFPLQLQASRVTEAMLGIVGIPAERSGNIIHLESVSLEVARACSGLRSLVTLLALGAVLAEGSLLPSKRGPHGVVARTLVFLGVIPVAVAVNSLRVALTAVLAAQVGLVLASGWAHELTGLLMFAASLVLLLLWRSVLRWVERRLPALRPAR